MTYQRVIYISEDAGITVELDAYGEPEIPDEITLTRRPDETHPWGPPITLKRAYEPKGEK